MLVSREPTVFVVDDEEDLRAAVKLLLTSMGMHVETFSSAEEFLDHYEPTCPGCLVLDVRMPGIGGPELQEMLHARQICIPVIIITGHGDASTMVRTLRAGAMGVIEKPFNDQTLLDSVHLALEQDRKNRSNQR